MEKLAVLKEDKVKGGEKVKPILIVEDEDIMRESLQDWLTDVGYKVETAEEGEKALEAIDEKDFGIVILDLKLPGKDGLEVLREAKAKRPQLKGIIITAYPSVQTAIDAMKEGAVDYLPKPFDLNELEKLVRETLGPIQVEIKPKKAAGEAKAEPAETEEVIDEVKVEEIIAIAPEEVPDHLAQGKTQCDAGQYLKALKEFEAVLNAAPGSIEARVWIRKAKEALAKPEAEAVAEGEEAAAEGKIKECVWMKMGMVAYRICTNDYDCTTCDFDQMMQEKMASGDAPELEAALEKFKALPGNQRLCRYALKGDVSHRICSRLFQCNACEFGQMMEDALQRKLDKLEARRAALLKKEQKQKAETEA